VPDRTALGGGIDGNPAGEPVNILRVTKGDGFEQVANKRKPGHGAGRSRDQSLTVEQAVGLACRHWEAGQTDQAERLCQQVLAAWPGHADALHLLGVIAHAYGNLDVALDYLRQACAAPRAPAAYHSNLAEMCRQKGLLAEGEAAGRRAVALDAAFAAGWNNLGIILQEAGKLEESLSCLERVAGLCPDMAEAENNLGNTLKRLGRLDEARRHYDAALALNPDYPEAYSNLANLLTELGDLEGARRAAGRAIDLNPACADAYVNLAAAETADGRHAEALRRLDAVLGFAPGHAGALGARADCLRRLERLEEAEASARRAVAAAPASGGAHASLAGCLQALGRGAEALAAYERAAALPAVAPEAALTGMARLLTETGRPAEALAALDRALTVNPVHATAWFARAELKTYGPADPDIAAMEALLADGRVQGRADRMALHFALGKAWLDAGDAGRAFGHLAEGNRMKRATFAFDVAAVEGWIASVAESFDADTLARLAGTGAGSELPVFVIGMPRSGTTLVEQILASHPEVHGAGELTAVQRLAEETLQPYPGTVPSLDGAALAGLGRCYLERVGPLAQGRARLVDKMPANFVHAGLIRLMLPGARIIHCRRDPVDTCLSCYTKLFSEEQAFAYDLAELGRFYRAYENLMAHWRAVLPAGCFLEVAYEDVVADLEVEARRLVAFCGLEWEARCLAFHENRRPVRTASAVQVRKPVYRASVGRWKPYARHLGPLLAALGIGD